MRKNKAQLLPVDSEHNAIFQSLPPQAQQQIGFWSTDLQLGISKIKWTGSGGPFRYTDLKAFEHITPEQAVAHPNWSMGKKNFSRQCNDDTNKGLGIYEGNYLMPKDEMEVIIHPQSIIHSMVRYIDWFGYRTNGKSDMRTPIAETMAYPHRTFAGVEPLIFIN